MKHISFELTMPNVGSWNGRWTGESKKYFVIRKFSEKYFRNDIQAQVFKTPESSESNFYYRWEDGWGANVHAQIVDAKEAKKRQKISSGFCGYEWMVASIIKYGKIYASHEEIPAS